MKRILLPLSLMFLFILIACNKKDTNSLQAIASRYFSTHSDMIGFGKLSVGQIVSQSKIQDIPLVGGMVKSELDGIKSSLNIDEYIYYGLSAKEKNDYTVTAFASVKNSDSLSKYIKERGYSITTKNHVNIAEEDELLFLFDKDIIVLKAGKDINKEQLITEFEAIKKAKGEENKLITEALESKAPIMFSLFPDKAYDLNAIDELKNVVSNDLYKGIIQTIDIQFNKGNVTLTNTFIGDEAKIKKLNFINNSSEAKSLKISGKDIVTLALNVDFARIEKENKKIFDFLTAKLDDELASSNDDSKSNKILATIRQFITKEKPLTSISNGVFYATADANPSDFTKPQVKFHLGSTNTELKNYFKTLLLDWDKSAQINVTNTAIEGTIYKHADINYSQNSGAGDNVFKLYIDINYLTNIFQSTDPNTAAYTKPIKNIDIYSNANVTKFIINTNDSGTNALEYLVKYYANIAIGG